MENAFELAIRNSAQLKVARGNTALARQKIDIAQLGRLPGISNTFNYGYLSNSQIWDPSSREAYDSTNPSSPDAIFRTGGRDNL